MVREDEAAGAAGFDGALAGRFLRRPSAGYFHSVWSETVLPYQSPHIGPAGDRLGGAGGMRQGENFKVLVGLDARYTNRVPTGHMYWRRWLGSGQLHGSKPYGRVELRLRRSEGHVL